MRPLSLTIEGLTAFRRSEFCEFTGLGLFVITGPTGAGKTSILDALTYALYGNVCRVKSGELKDLITHNVPLARVQLIFQAQGSTYRITRSMKRKGQPAALLEKQSDDEFVSIVDLPGIRSIDRHIAGLLGLDFQAFTKAVLLPQGRFHEFLSGDADTRRNILSRLLDLERYVQMGGLARQRARDISIGLAERKRRVDEDYGDATSEQLTQLAGAMRAAERRAAALGDARREAEELALEASRSRDRAAHIDRDLEAMGQLIGEVDQLAESIREAEPRDRETESAKNAAKDRLDRAQAVEVKAVRALQQCVERAGGNEVVLGQLLIDARTVGSETERLRRTEDEVTKATKQLSNATAGSKAAAAELASARAAREEAREAVERLREQFELAERAQKLAAERGRLVDLDKEVERVNDVLGRAASERGGRQAKLDHLQTEHRAAALRMDLRPGDHCPVCDQLISTVPETGSELDALITNAKKAVAAAEKDHATAQEAVSAARREQRVVTARISDLEAALPESGSELDLPAAKQAREAAATWLREAREAFPGLTEAADAAERRDREARDDRSSAGSRVDALERERQDLAGRIDQAREELRPMFGKQIPADVVGVLQSRLEEVTRSQEAVNKARDECAQARPPCTQAQAEREEWEREQQAVRSKLDQRWGEAMKAARALEYAEEGFGPLMDPAAEGSVSERATTLAGYCSAARDRGEAVRASTLLAGKACATKLAALAGRLNLESAEPTAEAFAARIEKEARSAEIALHDTRLDHCRHKSRLEKRNEIERSMIADKAQGDLYHRLGQELQADRFLAYVLGESMRVLAAQATSELLKITDGRYSIEPKESSFTVVDHHNADERRPVATLSGGETFLASLALALALSGSVRDLADNAAAARLESMFIDEGFGALDAETLDTAVGALEQLAGEHRMIGVISHVPALAERIPDGLEVRKVGASSTILRR